MSPFYVMSIFNALFDIIGFCRTDISTGTVTDTHFMAMDQISPVYRYPPISTHPLDWQGYFLKLFTIWCNGTGIFYQGSILLTKIPISNKFSEKSEYFKPPIVFWKAKNFLGDIKAQLTNQMSENILLSCFIQTQLEILARNLAI
jgi:hypothetical protein